MRDRTVQPGEVDGEWLDALTNVLPLFSLAASFVHAEPTRAVDEPLSLSAQLPANRDYSGRQPVPFHATQPHPHWLMDGSVVEPAQPNYSSPLVPNDATPPHSVDWEVRLFPAPAFIELPHLLYIAFG